MGCYKGVFALFNFCHLKNIKSDKPPTLYIASSFSFKLHQETQAWLITVILANMAALDTRTTPPQLGQ